MCLALSFSRRRMSCRCFKSVLAWWCCCLTSSLCCLPASCPRWTASLWLCSACCCRTSSGLGCRKVKCMMVRYQSVGMEVYIWCMNKNVLTKNVKSRHVFSADFIQFPITKFTGWEFLPNVRCEKCLYSLWRLVSPFYCQGFVQKNVFRYFVHFYHVNFFKGTVHVCTVAHSQKHECILAHAHAHTHTHTHTHTRWSSG